MSGYETVEIERHGATAVVYLNRPDSLNAFNGALRRDLLAAVESINNDPDIRVGILTGQGRAFSAGADLSEDTSGADFDVRDELKKEYKPVLMAIRLK